MANLLCILCAIHPYTRGKDYPAEARYIINGLSVCMLPVHIDAATAHRNGNTGLSAALDYLGR